MRRSFRPCPSTMVLFEEEGRYPRVISYTCFVTVDITAHLRDLWHTIVPSLLGMHKVDLASAHGTSG